MNTIPPSRRPGYPARLTALLLTLACMVPSAPALFWTDAISPTPPWTWSPWLGYFADYTGTDGGWIYHVHHEWLLAAGASDASLYFWSPAQGWWWTERTAYPYLYSFNETNWLYYSRDTARPRWFYHFQSGTWRADTAASTRLEPSDLQYLGAFRLPGGSGGSSWEWSGAGLTYCPEGDPAGAADGFPGSLFGIGHDWQMYVSEVSIPAPVISASKNLAELNTAQTLQPFADIRAFEPGGTDYLYGDIEYLPAQGGPSGPRLHYTFGRHSQFEKVASHGWCNLTLSAPASVGGWYVGPASGPPDIFSVNDYLFAIPAAWADRYAPGFRLATGRYREGGLGGQGPALYAIAPWQQGNPPPPGSELAYVRLLEYDGPGGSHTLNGYREADEWTGGAWLHTSAGRSAVVFVGSKGSGESWYGFPDGQRFPECLPGCDGLEDRGWWATAMQAQILFFDPAELGAVAEGAAPAHSPQPYAALNIDPVLFRTHTLNEERRVGACAWDAARSVLYVIEPLADRDEKSIVHAWRAGP